MENIEHRSLSLGEPRKPWFRARRNGFGWAPCSRAGWLVKIVAVLAIAAGDVAAFFVLFGDPDQPRIVAAAVAWNLLVSALVAVISARTSVPSA